MRIQASMFPSMLVLPSMPKGDIVGKLVFIVGCHLCQPLELDLNPWIGPDMLEICMIKIDGELVGCV
jgi:hypothetical protein